MSLNLCKITDYNFELCSAGMPPTYKYDSKNKTIEEILISGLPAGSLMKSKYKSEKSFCSKCHFNPLIGRITISTLRDNDFL